MPSYKLVYFPVRGRAEISRLLFAAAGVPFEDKKISDPQEWKDLKKQLPHGFLPVLEVDGKRLPQSLAIGRYLAREFGLAGKSNWDQAIVDMITETCDELRAELAKYIHEKDDIKKEALTKEHLDTMLPRFMGIFESYLKSNKGGEAFFVGSSLTLADIAVFETLQTPVLWYPNIFDKFPKLLSHRNRFKELPRIEKYLENRPQTEV